MGKRKPGKESGLREGWRHVAECYDPICGTYVTYQVVDAASAYELKLVPRRPKSFPSFRKLGNMQIS